MAVRPGLFSSPRALREFKISHISPALQMVFDVIPVLLFLVAVVLQAWAFGLVPTDNNGDPNDYLQIAAAVSPTSPIPPGVSYLRWPGYPYFVRIFALDGSSLTLLFASQAILFLFSVWFLVHSPGIPRPAKLILIWPALLPTGAFLTKLIFPDGLLLSLTLIMFGLLLRDKPKLAIAVALAAFIVKSIFIIAVLVATCAAIQKCGPKILAGRKQYAALAALPLAIPALWFINGDITFSNIAWRPLHNHDIPASAYLPNDLNLSVDCANFKGVIPYDAYKQRIPVEFNDFGVMPFGHALLDSYGCTKSQDVDLQHRLTMALFAYNPSLHVSLYFDHFFQALQGRYFFGHVAYMLIRKWQIASDSLSISQWYDETQLGEFQNLNIEPNVPAGYSLLSMSKSFDGLAALTSYTLETLAVLGLLVALTRRRFTQLIDDVRFRAASVFLIAYAFALAVGNYTLSDRFIFENLFVLAILAALGFGTTRKPTNVIGFASGGQLSQAGSDREPDSARRVRPPECEGSAGHE